MAPESADRVAATARLVAALNLGYFGIEATIGWLIGSVAVLADSIDFLEDASVNLLILAGLGLAAHHRARLGKALAALLLVPGLAALVLVWHRLSGGPPPPPAAVSLTGVGALLVNGTCALLIARLDQGTSLVRAAFLSARNDVIANLALIAVGPLTAATGSTVPDIVVGLGIGLLNIGAAVEVWELAQHESKPGGTKP